MGLASEPGAIRAPKITLADNFVRVASENDAVRLPMMGPWRTVRIIDVGTLSREGMDFPTGVEKIKI